MRILRLTPLILLVLGACQGVPAPANAAVPDEVARARQDSINRASPGYIVDSILPIEEELRRFREAVGGTPVTALRGGAASRDELVQALAAAVSTGDSVAVASLVLDAREFADLVYPESPYTKPPYRQPPGLLWMQISQASQSGRLRLLRRLGGRALRIELVTCPARPERQGQNTLWNDCTVRYASAAEGRPAHDGRLFGTVIERGGHFKFVSLANQY
jgi:hypothetical protein